MPEIKINETDHQILDILKEGRNSPTNISRRINKSRQYVAQRMTRLKEHGYLKNIGSGIYELKKDPRKQ